jgi:ABC-type glycerol-3-phosphate transport system permease component
MPRKLAKGLTRLAKHVVLAVASAFFLVPIWHMIATSLKAEDETLTNPGLIPRTIDLAKYADVWREANLMRGGLNSLIITSTTVLGVLTLASLAAYALSRRDFLGRRPLYLLFLTGLMLPTAGIIIPLYRINQSLGLINTYAGIIGPYVALGLPFAILLLRNYFDTLPKEMEESAVLDGASGFTIFLRILLPLTKPVLATVAVFQFLGTWNELLLALLFVNQPAKQTLPLRALIYQQMYSWEYERMFSVFVIMTLPVTMFYVLMQRQLIAGLTAGAVKGL